MTTDPKAALRELESRAKKRFGQHFLTRRDVVDRMIRATPVQAGDRVVEIGPGLGILTDALLEAGAEVTAVEIDRDLAAWIAESRPSVRLVQGDAMRVDWATTCPGGGWKMVANLPYNVGTPIVADAMTMRGTFSVLTVMLQREVVLRLLAEPDSDAYGALSVRTAAYTAATSVVHVPPGAFHPPPRVDSMVVRLELRAEPLVGPAGERTFDRVVKAAFAQRRKTILNSLSTLFPKAEAGRALEAAGIPTNTRAETLDLGAFQALAAGLTAI